MSSNTNTLFWVITGAVIVLAIYGLVNVNKDNINNMTNKFDTYFEEIKEESERDYDSDYNKNSNVIYKKTNVVSNDEVEIKINYMRVDEINNTIEFEYRMKNIANKVLLAKNYYLYIKDSETNNIIFEQKISTGILLKDKERTKVINGIYNKPEGSWKYYLELGG